VTITQYRSGHLRQFFKDTAVADIADRHIDLYIKHRLKMGRSRTTVNRVIVGEIANIIARRQAERVESCPNVFHRQGNRIKHYNRAWRTARVKAGLPEKLMHDNRRSAARNMDRAGVPRQVAKQITGHKTDSMYNRYNIVNEKDVREGMAQAQAYLAAHHSGQNLDNRPEQKDSSSQSTDK